MNNNSQKVEELLEVLYGTKGIHVYEEICTLITAWQDKTDNRDEKNWISQNDVMLITYGDSINDSCGKPLTVLNKFLNKYAKGTISDVHILPMFPYTSDDGFSVVDYYQVNSELGTWQDVRNLSKSFDLMFDAVVNHISKSSKWFKGFLEGKDEYRDFFIVADPTGDYSKVTRPRALPLLTPFETADGEKHIWTTFSEDQIDLNFSNPKVLIEILDVLLTYAYNGAKFIRLDAIGFAWKKMGTTCMHLKETHAIVKLMRAVLDQLFPGTIIITETNVPHLDNISYFGDGFDEAHMVYQFPLPPLVLFSFLTGNAAKLGKWAHSLEETPISSCTSYFNFLASHDGIGMRPTDGILSEEEKDFMLQAGIKHGGRISYKINSDSSKSPYELNINYMDALTDPNSSSNEVRVKRFIAAQGILLSVIGVPGIYIHSLLGSQNWYQGVEESGINRRINREKLDFEKVCSELEDENSFRSMVFSRFSNLIRLRRNESAFSSSAPQQVLFLDERAFTFIRHNVDTNEKIFVAIDVSGQEYQIKSQYEGIDIVSGEKILAYDMLMLPYSIRWIKIR
jgi:glucosylglycerate phosphorylase